MSTDGTRTSVMTGRMRSLVSLALTATVLAACTGSASPASPPAPSPAVATRELIDPGTMYAGASQYGDLVFTAGFLGDASGDDFAADVTNALDQLEAALEASGAGLDTLLKVNIYLTDWDDWETFNAVYTERIGPLGLPPRTTVEVSQLGLDAPIEIAAVAHVRAP